MSEAIGAMKRRESPPSGERRWLSIAALASLLGCAGCAHTESVEPIAMAQQGDENLTCQQLKEQIADNQRAAMIFANRAAQTQGSNEVFEAVSIFSMWASFGINLSEEDKVKFRSLQDRDQYLLYLKGQKKC